MVTAATAAAYAAWRRAGGPGWGTFLRLGLLLVALAVLLQPLVSSAGETLLFELPSWGVGSVRIGGPVTLESVAFGVIRGLALTAVLLTFAAFSAAVDPYRLVRSIPRFLYRSGIALSIALTFIPQTLTAQREIRQAMALRGRRFRGLRDLVRLFVALLAGGLERSIDLAEAMEARGFGGEDAGGVEAADGGTGRAQNVAIAAGLAAIAGGLYATSAASGVAAPGGATPRTVAVLGWLLIGGGALAVAAALYSVARGVRRTRYRPQRWRRADGWVTVASLTALAAFAAAWTWRRHELTFYPFPRWQTPALTPWLAAALALLAAPAAAARAAPRDDRPAGADPDDPGAAPGAAPGAPAL